jgi:hypothetical protein
MVIGGWPWNGVPSPPKITAGSPPDVSLPWNSPVSPAPPEAAHLTGQARLVGHPGNGTIPHPAARGPGAGDEAAMP